MREYTKNFLYTSKDRDADAAAGPEAKTNIFSDRMKEAHEYSLQIHDPRFVNWVRMEFIWY